MYIFNYSRILTQTKSVRLAQQDSPVRRILRKKSTKQQEKFSTMANKQKIKQSSSDGSPNNVRKQTTALSLSQSTQLFKNVIITR